MLSGTRNGYAIQYFKEVKIKLGKKIGGGTLFLRQFTPCVIYFLCLPENRIDIRLDIQLFVKFRRIAFIGKSQLITKIVEAVINWGCGKHKYLCLDTWFDDSVHQTHIAILFFATFTVGTIAISEVMAFIYDDKVIISPVDSINRQSNYSVSAVTRKVRMIQNVIAKPIFCEWVINQISTVGHPVLGQLFRTKYENIFVAAFVILDDSKCRKCFAETNTVCKNAAVVLLQFIDNCKRSIFLEVEQLIPDYAVFKTGSFVWQYIF